MFPVSAPVRDKATTLLAHGRVQVQEVHDGRVVAQVTGMTGTYMVRRWPGRGWSCNCADRSGHCSHQTAVRLVVAEGM